jgi:hypothetical protein
MEMDVAQMISECALPDVVKNNMENDSENTRWF